MLTREEMLASSRRRRRIMVALDDDSYVADNAEAAALFGRFATPATDARKALIDTFIGALKDAGVWTKLDFLHVMAAHDAQAARRNWIADQYNLTEAGGLTFAADRGYAGNGTTGYLGTGVLASALTLYTQAAASLGAWALTAGTAARSIMGTQPAGFSIRVQNNAGATERGTRINVSSSHAVDDNLTTGFVVATRANSTNVSSYRNGAGGSDVVVAGADARSTEEVTYLRSAGSYGDMQAAIGFAGGHLTAGEVSDFYNAAHAYLQGVGAL